MSELVGRVAELWRFPVKSMQGARVESVRLDVRGVHGDRLWAVRDLADRRTTSARRLPVLLGCTAAYVEEPGPDAGPGRPVAVVVTLPGGEELTSGDPALDARLSELCGRDVALVPLPPLGDRAAHRGGLVSGAAIRRELGLADDEPLPDAAAMPVGALATVARYSTPPGMFTDLAPVHLLTTQAVRSVTEALGGPSSGGSAAAGGPSAGGPSAGEPSSGSSSAGEDGSDALSVRRFRPTVLVDLTGPADSSAYPERAWVGGRVHLGTDAVLPVTMPTVRCVVPSREQPGLERRRPLSRALVEVGDRFLGVYADVARPGTVHVGDEVRVEHHHPSAARSALDRLRTTVVRAGSHLLP